MSDAVAVATRLYHAGRYHEVGALCEKVLERRPQQFDALYLKSLIAYRFGNHQSGARLIERACSVRPEVTHFDHMTGYLRQTGRGATLSVLESRLWELYKHSQIEGFLISYAKCGRTWVRLMLGRYLLRGRKGDPIEILEVSGSDPGVPTIHASHDDYPHLKPATELHEDKTMYRGKSVAFLVRDPRDVLVSNYFQYTRRGDRKIANDNDFSGSLSDFVRYKIGGIANIVQFYNIWAQNRDVPERFQLLRYEDLHADARGEVTRLIAFFGLPDFGRGAIDDAVAFGDFNNMRQLEKTNQLGNIRLRPPPDGDPGGFKLHKGVVGGYRDYLSKEDVAYIDDYLHTELDDYFSDYKVP